MSTKPTKSVGETWPLDEECLDKRSRRQRVSSALLSQRLIPFLATAGIVMFVFSAFRIGLMIGSWRYLGACRARDVVTTLFQGIRYDLVPLAIILIPIALLLSICSSKTFSKKFFSRLITWYVAAVLTIVVLVETIGAAFFCYFSDRLDAKAVHYIEYYKDVFGHIIHSYPVWLIAVIPVICIVGLYYLLRMVFRRTRAPEGRRGSRRIHAAFMIGICLLCCFAAPRGAYFSSNRLLVQLSLNNLSSFVKSVWSSVLDPWDEDKYFQFPSESVALDGARALLWQDNDTSLGRSGLWRRTDTPVEMRRPNVVMIVMESMSGLSVGALGAKKSHTPYFDEICKNGLFFDRMYGVGSRTTCGLVGLLCSHPDLTGKTVLQRPESIGQYYTLPSMLRDRGYRTMFIYGADPEFDNMRNFFINGGIDELICRDQMQGVKGTWGEGYQDEVIFGKAHEVFSAADPKKPFFAVILTLSNHDPWVIPNMAGKIDLLKISKNDDRETATRKRMQNAYRYADWALGRFFQRAEEENSPYLDNTIFVLVADHRQQADADRDKMIDIPGFRVPCVFYAPKMPDLVPQKTISTVCSQTDVAPTLMTMLGGSYVHSFMGRDILSVKDDGFALLRDGNPIGFIHGNKAVILPPRSWARLYDVDEFSMKEISAGGENTNITKALEAEMMSYYGSARYLLKKRAFCPPIIYPCPAGRFHRDN